MKFLTSDKSTEELAAESKVFVGALDRSALGNFAIREDALVLADTILRITVAFGSQGEFYSVPSAIQYEYALDDIVVGSGLSFTNVYGEALYWRKVVDDATAEDVAAFVKAVGYGDATEAQMHRLGMVAKFPMMHNYFALGIWDARLIAGYIDAGIDPALAISMERA